MNSPIENVTNSFKKKWSGIFSDNKDVLIILLSALLLLSILGVHFFHVILEAIENVVDRVLVLLGHVLAGVSYSTGEILNVSADTVSDVAKVTIDLGNGAVNDVGNVLKSGGRAPLYSHPCPFTTSSPPLPRDTARPKRPIKSPIKRPLLNRTTAATTNARRGPSPCKPCGARMCLPPLRVTRPLFHATNPLPPGVLRHLCPDTSTNG